MTNEEFEIWALSQPDLPAGGTVLAALKGLVERLRANVKRLEDLCHRWNKMAAHFAAGSEFTNDPERVLEALKSRQKMEQGLRDKRREQSESLEQSLAAAQKYATELCISMAKAYPAVPDWKPLEDLHGVLMQIDNMWCGYRDRLTAAQEELRVERERLDWLTDIAAPSGDLELKRDLDKWWLFVSSAAYSQDDPDPFDNPRAAIDAARSQKGGTDAE